MVVVAKKAVSRDLLTSNDACCRGANSSWWEWEEGSRPFHWRWPIWYQERICDGVAVKFTRTPPKAMIPQRDVREDGIKELVCKKLSEVVDIRYLVEGVVVSLISFFPVPKGEEDIRMVYDGTVNGLNDSIWVPSFQLPTVWDHLRAVDLTAYMADVDVKAMFLNFPLHETLQQYCGVDLQLYGNSLVKIMRWDRAAMGLKSSPFQCVQGMAVAMEVIKGVRKDPKNVYRWTKVALNLPGSKGYDVTKPWISLEQELGEITANSFHFVDDLRSMGPGKIDSQRVARQAASTMNWLGLQDASQKRRRPSQNPGAWAGSIMRILNR